MTRCKVVPEPVIVVLSSVHQSGAAPSSTTASSKNLREGRIQEFLQSRSLSSKSQKAYRQDLQHFLNWTAQDWANITPRHIAQFKAHLMQKDLESGQPKMAVATVRRILGTLKSFYRWMARSGYVKTDPTTEVLLPKQTLPEVQNLKLAEVQQIYQAIAASSLSERNRALVSILLHGLRTEELSSLNVGDYDGQQVQIQRKKLDTKGIVPLSELGKQDLEHYLQWRQASGEVLFSESPLFVSHSRRNPGQRLGYEGIRKAIDQIAQQTGIDFHAYRFRHTFAMNLVAQGISSHHAITLTRHRSIQNFRRYTQAAEQAGIAGELGELNLAKAPD